MLVFGEGGNLVGAGAGQPVVPGLGGLAVAGDGVGGRAVLVDHNKYNDKCSTDPRLLGN